ncbi:MAG: PHP domain-containing protein [Simkania sp.]|nr:PHP domain-containing protein [Simkania sp.]
MDYRADLHCHTTCSDGTMTPKEVLHHAKEKGLSALSFTDHDTLDAYTDEIWDLAKELGIDLFVGVEFSTRYHKVSVHILGYGVQKTEKLLAFCEEHKHRRNRRNLEILKKLSSLSLVVTEEELEAKRTGEIVGRPHIAQIMVEKGYVRSIQDAFDRYIGDRKSCFVEGEPFAVQETIDTIHDAGGKAFIAHPHLIQKAGVLRFLLGMNFDGIECYYSLLYHEMEKKWLKIAREKNWLISGGSDFHGAVKPQVTLGCSWVDRETVESIFGKTHDNL